MTYDLCITAVSERADLFAQAMKSISQNLDTPPMRIFVHEDVRPGSKPGTIAGWLAANVDPGIVVHRVSSPAAGLGSGMLWCFEQTSSPYVLYTQEDIGAARPFPIRRALEVMDAGNCNQIRFNQRTTLPCKHGDKGRNPNAWRKVEVQIDGQTLCVSDHFYTPTALWRVAPALAGMRAVLKGQTISSSGQFVARFNDWMNRTHGDGVRPWNDQMMRHERLRTYIWGPIGEPAFLTNLDPGNLRTTSKKA